MSPQNLAVHLVGVTAPTAASAWSATMIADAYGATLPLGIAVGTATGALAAFAAHELLAIAGRPRRAASTQAQAGTAPVAATEPVNPVKAAFDELEAAVRANPTLSARPARVMLPGDEPLLELTDRVTLEADVLLLDQRRDEARIVPLFEGEAPTVAVNPDDGQASVALGAALADIRRQLQR